VRALWAGKAFVWHIYPQDDEAHLDKLVAFLDMLQAPPSLRAFHLAWNRKGASQKSEEVSSPVPALELPAWQGCALVARIRLMAQEDLCTRLIRFVAKNR
jgi:hypothetical protein